MAMVQVGGLYYVSQDDDEDGWLHTLDKLSRKVVPEVPQHFNKDGLI